MAASDFVNLNPLLDRLRQQIHRYLVTDGVLIGIAFLIAVFWIALALDFLPVLLGANEMPLAARRLLLAATLVGLLVIGYWWILRRTRVPILDRQLALLIERQHPELNERLLTTVEQDAVDGVYAGRMMERTRESLRPLLDHLDLSKIMNYRLLARRGIITASMLLSIIVVPLMAGELLSTAWQRLVLLRDVTYPRRTFLEVQGFQNGQLTVARGSDVTMVVHADATRPTPPPRLCTISYQLPDGTRGRVNMSRQGSVVNGRQEYVFSGKPFQNILSDVELNVRGNDYTVRDLRIRVVDSPQITSAQLKITLPAYTGLVPRTVAYRPGMAIPVGSDLSLYLTANKPLVRALRVEPPGSSPSTADDSTNHSTLPTSWTPPADHPETIEIDLNHFSQDLILHLALEDQDGITSSQPYPLALAALSDQAPQVDVRLHGIGSSITPSARLPLEGTIRDDYGVAESWIELVLADSKPLKWPSNALSSDRFSDALDLWQQRRSGKIAADLPIDSRITVSVRASDRYDLNDDRHIGQGDVYELEVVRPERLLSILEARELGLRERFEQIVDEMRQMRESLQRAVNPNESATDLDLGAEPEDTHSAAELAEQGAPEREGGLNRLRVQRAVQHAERAAQEVAGVAFAIDDIRAELINNRIDSSDRQQRLKDDIADPLHQIADVRLVELGSQLVRLEGSWQQIQDRQLLGSDCLRLTDEAILAMEQVLARMLDLESYHELLDLMRSLIDEQERLERLTREEQRRQFLEMIETPPDEEK